MKWYGILAVAALPTLALASGTGQEKKTDKKAEEPKPVSTAKLEIGKPAPAFELKDLDGKTVKLSDYKGKTVVLEWFNPECPFVVYAHKEGSLKDMAAKATKDGIVWLAINSSGAGLEGSDVEKNKKMHSEWKMEHALLLDPEGTVGRAYESKNTPTMYIIDAKGNLAYHGGVDNAPMGKAEGDKIVNYVETALAEIKAGKPVTKAETKPYGCGVKYAKPRG